MSGWSHVWGRCRSSLRQGSTIVVRHTLNVGSPGPEPKQCPGPGSPSSGAGVAPGAGEIWRALRSPRELQSALGIPWKGQEASQFGAWGRSHPRKIHCLTPQQTCVPPTCAVGPPGNMLCPVLGLLLGGATAHFGGPGSRVQTKLDLWLCHCPVWSMTPG